MGRYEETYNGSMAPNADSRAHSVRNSSPTRIMQPGRDIAEERTGTNGCLPRAVVHAEVLEVDHVDRYCSIGTT